MVSSPEQDQDPSRWSFTFDDFLRREYRFGLDSNRPPCKAFLQGHCPQGSNCPDRHQTSSSYNNLICKHWLRGLCKKGATCEFLHEYNLRRMPECNYFSRHGNCSNGDDCLFLHIAAASKRPPCSHYDRGFCPLGPNCVNKHIRRPPPCPFYLAGFCPEGRQCAKGSHPRYRENLKKPESKFSLENGEGDLVGDVERGIERDIAYATDGAGAYSNTNQSGPKLRGSWQRRKNAVGRRQ